jgi:hypothetical protein
MRGHELEGLPTRIGFSLQRLRHVGPWARKPPLLFFLKIKYKFKKTNY